MSVVSPKCQRTCGERLRKVLGCGAVFRISSRRMQGDAVDPEEDQTFSWKRPLRARQRNSHHLPSLSRSLSTCESTVEVQISVWFLWKETYELSETKENSCSAAAHPPFSRSASLHPCVGSSPEPAYGHISRTTSPEHLPRAPQQTNQPQQPLHNSTAAGWRSVVMSP